MQFKRARRPLHFYSDLAQYESINGGAENLTETTIETKTRATQTTTETTNETYSSQTSNQITNSGPKTRKSKHDWMDSVVKECMIVGNSSNSIMRIVNQFIIASKIQKQMVSQTTIRNKMSKILLKESQDHHTRGQKVIGMDGKCDKTLTLKG